MKKPQINPRQEQQEKLKEIGDRLQQIRLQQGLSLETLAHKTRIQARLLRAIEAGNLEILPEPVYIRGLIKQFANSLDLEGDQLANSFPTGLGNVKIKNTTWQRLPGIQLRPFHLYLLYVLVVAVSVKGLSQMVQRPIIQVQNPAPQQQQLTPSSVASNTDTLTVKTLPVSQTSANGKPVIVEIQLKDQSWLKVVVDGRTEFEGVLPEGTHRTWEAKQQLTVRAGNAGGVMVAFNNEQAKKLGERGQVQEVTYQANSRS